MIEEQIYTIGQLLDCVQEGVIKLIPCKGGVTFRGPTGLMSDDLVERLAINKSVLFEHLFGEIPTCVQAMYGPSFARKH